MGINEFNFKWIHDTLKSLGLKKEDLIVTEIGTHQILYNGNELPVLSYYGEHRGHLYKKYVCLDLQAAPCTVITDLSKPVVVDEKSVYLSDLVLNLGTAEHVEPARGHYECWKNMHRLTKKGAVQIHDLPKWGYWKDHCRFWYTENFCNELARQNNYTMYGLGRREDKVCGEAILATFIKNEDNEFMSYDEFMKIINFDPEMEIPKGNNNPKNLQKNVKVISFCLWGQESRYERGLIENIKLAGRYFPDWECWVYLHVPTVNPVLQEELKKYVNVKVILKTEEPIRIRRFMLWRLEPVDDSSVSYVMSRDTDTRISPREVLAVQEWLDSGKTLHIIRDHPQHYPKILGGMFGLKCSSLPKRCWKDEVEKFYGDRGYSTDDQTFLEEKFYDLYKNDRVIHDEIKRYEGDECKQFPLPFEQTYHFIGGYVYEDGTTNPKTTGVLKNWLQKNLKSRISKSRITYEQKLIGIGNIIKNIYVMHYTKLVDRKVSLNKQLRNLLLDRFVPVNWIENFDRENLTPEILEKKYKYDPSILTRVMTLAEIANGIAHTYILKTIQDRNEIGLVIEDDTIFKKGFVDHLWHLLLHLPEDWEMICLGGPTYDSVMPSKSLPGVTRLEFNSDEIKIYKPSSPGPATVSCFLVNRKGVDKLLSSGMLDPLSTPIDDAIWKIGMKTDLKMYWCQPWISYEGSKTDMFSTSLERGF